MTKNKQVEAFSRQALFGVVALAILAGASSTANADDDTFGSSFDDGFGGELDLIELIRSTSNSNMVSASTRHEQTLEEAPARTILFSRDRIEEAGYRYLRDLLQDIPGYVVAQNSISEWGSSVSVRGLGGNHRLLFLVDGHRINPPGGEEVPLFDNYPMMLVQSVEVVFGPGSAAYGSDVFNGIVSIRTRKIGEDGEGKALLNIGLGTPLTTTTVAGGTMNRFGGFELRLTGHYTDREPFDSYANYPNEHTVRLPNGDLVDVPLVQEEGFEAGEQGYDLLAHLQYGKSYLRYSLRGYDLSSSWDRNAIGTPFLKDARFSDSQQMVTMGSEWKRGTWDLSVKGDYSMYDIDPDTRFAVPVNLEQGAFESNDHRAGKSTALRFEARADKEVIEDDLFVSVGVAAQRFEVTPMAFLSSKWDSSVSIEEQAAVETYRYYDGPGSIPNTDIDGLVRDDNPNLFTAPEQLLGATNVDFQVYSIYAQSIWSAAKSLQITGGVRYDWTSRFGSIINPRLAAVLLPSESYGFKFLYGRAFLEPTPFEVYGAFIRDQQLLAPSPDLQPEVLNSVEVVSWVKPAKDLKLTVNGYYNLISDTINAATQTNEKVYVDVVVNGTPQLQQNDLLQSRNTGAGKFFGGQGELEYQYKFLTTRASTSFTHGRTNIVDRVGRTLTQEPDGLVAISARLSITAKPRKGVSVNVRGRYLGAPKLYFDAEDYPNAAKANATLVVDSNIRLNLKESVGIGFPGTFYLQGTNLLNSRYKLGSGRPAVNPIGTPQPGRTIFAGLEIDLDYDSPL